MNREEYHLQWSLKIYQNFIDAIENAKRRQWLILNYVLLAFAAIFGYARLSRYPTDKLSTSLAIILISICFLLSLFGIYNLLDTHTTQVRHRILLWIIRKNHVYIADLIPMGKDQEKEYYLFSYYFKEITVPQIFAITFAFIMVILYLAKRCFIDETPIWILIIVPFFWNALSTAIFARRMNSEVKKRSVEISLSDYLEHLANG